MKIEYDKETDTLTLTLRDARVKESDEVRPGVIADFGYDGGVVGFEILDASKWMENPPAVEFVLGTSDGTPATVREKPKKYGKKSSRGRV
ncbi:MAG: DUF2283 domain-containing protein [Verrucomicrobiia bacterium]|jgi:uncharacterized protein YuzE